MTASSPVPGIVLEIHGYLVALPAWDADRVRDLLVQLENAVREECRIQYRGRVTDHAFEGDPAHPCTMVYPDGATLCAETFEMHALREEEE